MQSVFSWFGWLPLSWLQSGFTCGWKDWKSPESAFNFLLKPRHIGPEVCGAHLLLISRLAADPECYVSSVAGFWVSKQSGKCGGGHSWTDAQAVLSWLQTPQVASSKAIVMRLSLFIKPGDVWDWRTHHQVVNNEWCSSIKRESSKTMH